MKHSPPLISIITVVYQAVKTVEQTIQSVLEQDSVYEYIVIDGGSTDGTLDIIHRYEQQLSYFISEPDKGIYEAMNKGVARAKGEWIYFLGADDILMPHVLANLKNILINTSAMLVYGDVLYDYGKHFRSDLDVKIYLHNTVHHQAAFYKRKLFNTFSFDTSLKIIADYELNLIIYLTGKVTYHVDTLIAKCAGGGSSYNVDLSLHETNKVRSKHVSKSINSLLTYLLSVKYFVSYVLLRKV